MNKPFKFSSKTHKILFCSDLHCKHNPTWSTPPLWSSRGFASIEEHDIWIKAKWFELVDKDTIVFNLGDTVFSDPKGEWFREFTKWPGSIITLNGNHLSGHKQVYREHIDLAQIFVKHESIYPLYVGNVSFIGDQFHTFIDGISVYMQHYAPYIWPETKEGGFALCGHSHARCVELNPETTNFGKILDVGVDNAIRLFQSPFFTWDQIKTIMAQKPIRTSDHH